MRAEPDSSSTMREPCRHNVPDDLHARKRLCLLLWTALLAGISAFAQENPDPLITGVSLLSPKNCPVFIGSVMTGSPAERAGVHAGDRVLKINGKPVADLQHELQLLRSSDAATVTWTLFRGGKELEVVSGRARQSVLAPGPTKAEQHRMDTFDQSRIVDGVFRPSHYPPKPDIFYAGFEIFMLKNPAQAMVGGIEKGPASKAGVRWGDILISVNGAPIAGKTRVELEKMFSATEPAPMRLTFESFGSVKNVEFRLEKAQEIARQNGWRLVDGRPVPIWVTAQDLLCFVQ